MGRWRTTRRFVARALRLWRPTRRSIVCCQQCAACFVARALLLCVLATRRSIAVCQQCAALCQRAFLAPLHNWCANCWAAVVRHNIRLLARCFNAALRACTHAFIGVCANQRRAKPDTKRPPPRACPPLRTAFQSSVWRWTCRFWQNRRCHSSKKIPHTISVASANTPSCNDTARSARQYNV